MTDSQRMTCTAFAILVMFCNNCYFGKSPCSTLGSLAFGNVLGNICLALHMGDLHDLSLDIFQDERCFLINHKVHKGYTGTLTLWQISKEFPITVNIEFVI